MDYNRLCPSHSNQGIKQQLFAKKKGGLGGIKEGHEGSLSYILFNVNVLNISKSKDLGL